MGGEWELGGNFASFDGALRVLLPVISALIPTMRLRVSGYHSPSPN